MQRDMDLARRILLEVEKAPFGDDVDVVLDGVTEAEITYHVLLLHEAGLISARDYSTLGGIEWKPIRLTWHGHEFLDAARDEDRWNKAKEQVSPKGGTLSFDVLKALLIELAKKSVGL